MFGMCFSTDRNPVQSRTNHYKPMTTHDIGVYHHFDPVPNPFRPFAAWCKSPFQHITIHYKPITTDYNPVQTHYNRFPCSAHTLTLFPTYYKPIITYYTSLQRSTNPLLTCYNPLQPHYQSLSPITNPVQRIATHRSVFVKGSNV